MEYNCLKIVEVLVKLANHASVPTPMTAVSGDWAWYTKTDYLPLGHRSMAQWNLLLEKIKQL